MKEIKLIVTDEQYQGYLLSKKYELHSDSGGCTWDEDDVIYLLHSGYESKIAEIKRFQEYLETHDESVLEWTYCVQKYACKPTKRCIAELNGFLQEQESIDCVKLWNKYHPYDKIIL